MAFPSVAEFPRAQKGLSHNVVDLLRDMISRGELQQGEHLKEGEISAALGVSRGPVREAFAQLENEGYVEIRPRRGAYVVTLTRQDIIEVYTLRLALERLATERATSRMTPARLERMDALLEQFRVGDDYSVREAVRLDLVFHDMLYEAAEHGRLKRSWDAIRSQVEFFLNARNLARHDFHTVGYTEHREIRDALASGDTSRAVEVIENHLVLAYSMLLADRAGESD